MSYILNFSAFCLPLVIFSFWGVVGYASLSILRTQRNIIQNLLLAPVVGYSVTLLFVFWLNRIGLPVSYFAIALFAALLVGSGVILVWKKSIFPVKHYFPFGVILIFVLCLIGSPFLKFGFEWISFGNDDMANYTLGALRFLNYGYFDIPNVNDLIEKKDYSLIYWFLYVPGIIRAGSEMMLAWVSGVARLNPLQIFMPTIIALHLMLISTTGALVYISRRFHYIAIVTCLLLSLSALTVLGTLSQLIAQVSGLSLLVAAVILLCQSFSIHKKFYYLTQGILIAITLSTLFIVYPEVTPFLGVSFFAYLGISFWQGWRGNKSFFLSFICISILTSIFLNTHLIAVIEFIKLQSGIINSKVTSIVLFPYFLIPSGLANLWGFLPLTRELDEPSMSIVIVTGAIFLFLVISASIRLTIRKSLPAIVSLVMILVGIDLFITKYGFGLFKLAMFVQPFFISVIVITIFELVKNNRRRNLLFLVLILSGVNSINFYLERSKAKTPGSFAEIPYGSNTNVNQEYRSLIADLPKDTLLLSDDFNISLIKFQAAQSSQFKFVSLTSPNNFIYLTNVLLKTNYLLPRLHSKIFHTDQAKEIARLYYLQGFYPAHFNLHDVKDTQIDFTENNSCVLSRECNERGYIIADTALRSIFNRRATSLTSNFSLKKFSETRNHLVFLDSSLGRIYHSVVSNNLGNLSLFNLERDVIYSDKSMQSLGRYLLMKVFNPAQKVRLEIALTNTFDGNGLNQLPPASVVGNKRLDLPIIGRGSARIFSEPFSPQKINGQYYIAIDMNTEGSRFPYQRKGIMSLFNKDLILDLRKVVTFSRDISLISEEEYQKLTPPSSLQDFPRDLANQNLAYSGIYEDGWISENSFVQLKQPNLSRELLIQGMLPKINSDFTQATLLIICDGKKLAKKEIQPGEFSLRIPVVKHSISHKIELHFNKTQKLSGGDNRPIGAYIKFIGFA